MEKEFKLNKPKTEESIPKPFNYDLWKQNQDVLHPEKSGRFLVTSLFLHGVFILMAFAASLQLFEDKKTETVEIELLNSGEVTALGQPQTEASQPMSAPQAVAAPESSVAEAPVKAAQDEVVIPVKAQALPVHAEQKPAAQAVALPQKTIAPTPTPKVSSARVQTYQAPSPVVLPDSVDDIQEPQLEKASAADVNPNDINDDEDLKKDFAKVDQKQNKQALALAQDLEAQTNNAASETEKIAEEANQKNAMEGEKIAMFNASQRARDAQAIAAADAAERAAAAKIAQEAKEARAAQAAKNAAAASAAAAAASAAEAAKANAGNGNDSSGTADSASGSPTGVRDAQDLRQRPGNPLPQYDQNERLSGHQGKVVFLAYVTPEGVPTQFKLADSTGFKNLDGKTLKALKQWRFFPGQEGWVEMAFNWSLKGGAQEIPALLKRSKK